MTDAQRAAHRIACKKWHENNPRYISPKVLAEKEGRRLALKAALDSDTKLCSRCLFKKSKDDFYKNRRNKDGLQNHCKGCTHRPASASRENDARQMAA